MGARARIGARAKIGVRAGAARGEGKGGTLVPLAATRRRKRMP